jgi:hypothetical protein
MIVTLLIALLATFSPVPSGDLLNGGASAVPPHAQQGVLSIDGVSSGGPTGSSVPIRMPAPSDTHSGGPTG